MKEDEISIEEIMDRPPEEEAPKVTEEPRREPDPYERHLPLLVREQKETIKSLTSERDRDHKRFVISLAIAITLGVLLSGSVYFLIRAYEKPLKEVEPFTLISGQMEQDGAKAVNDTPTGQETDPGANTGVQEGSETNGGQDGSETGPKTDIQDPTAGATDLIAGADSQPPADKILDFDLNGIEYGFPVNSEELIANGWQVLSENPDDRNPDLMVVSMYNEAGDGAYLYRTAEGEVTGFAVGLATEESTMLGVKQGMTLAETDEVFYDATDSTSDNAEATEGRGAITYSYEGYEITVTFVNGGASSVELTKN